MKTRKAVEMVAIDDRTHAKVHNIITIIEEKQQQNAMIFREAVALIGFLFG